MELPFFFEEELPDKPENFVLSAETSKHIIQVLRMKAGDHLILTNGKGIEMNVTVLNPDKRGATVSFNNKRNLLSPDNQNAIAISLLKNENRFEWFLEKATELGIHKIYPLITSRTEKRTFRQDRMKNIMVSAMLQSKQYFLPYLSEPIRLNGIFELNDFQQKLIAHCTDEDSKAALTDIIEKDASKIVLIGPEGDFTEDEIADCRENGFLPVSLGNTRLRTETAGIFAAVFLVN